MSDIPVTGEVSNSKLAAVFDSESAARAAAEAVVNQTGLQSAQVKLITPREPHPNIKLQPEGQGIWHTILLAHLWLGIAGLVAGALVFGLLMWLGVTIVVSSPVVSAVVFVFFGAVGGLMLGGVVSLRPDQDRYVQAAQDAIADHRTTVVVHALSAGQADQAADILSGLGAEVTRTL